MKPELNDIRLLKMAEMYETAFERFIVELAARYVQDEEVRAQLTRLTEPDEHGDRIARELERLNARIGDEDRADVERAALLDVGDVERAAREFYLRHADQVHDPQVAALFRELAREEAHHAAIAEEALRLADRKAGRQGADREGLATGSRLLGPGERVPLWEGVSEFRRSAATKGL